MMEDPRKSLSDYERGRWDMFELISSLEYGKQCYFLEKRNIVYSRCSCSYMNRNEALNEFLNRIEEQGLEW